MSTRKSMRFPMIITLIIIIIIIYLFATIKQTRVVCEKNNLFDSDVKIEESIIIQLDGKSIKEINVTKTFILPNKYNNERYLNSLKFSLENTLEYLGDKVNYKKIDNKLIVNIKVNKNEIILLDNVEIIDNNDLEIKINSNTKSSDIVSLKVGDKYTDGELKKHLKNNGYICK